MGGRKETVVMFVAALVVIALVAGSAWVHFGAPCSWHRFGAAKDVPARCVIEVGR